MTMPPPTQRMPISSRPPSLAVAATTTSVDRNTDIQRPPPSESGPEPESRLAAATGVNANPRLLEDPQQPTPAIMVKLQNMTRIVLGTAFVIVLLSLIPSLACFFSKMLPWCGWSEFLRLYAINPASYALGFFLLNEVFKWAFRQELDALWA